MASIEEPFGCQYSLGRESQWTLVSDRILHRELFRERLPRRNRCGWDSMSAAESSGCGHSSASGDQSQFQVHMSRAQVPRANQVGMSSFGASCKSPWSRWNYKRDQDASSSLLEGHLLTLGTPMALCLCLRVEAQANWLSLKSHHLWCAKLALACSEHKFQWWMSCLDCASLPQVVLTVHSLPSS